VRGMFSGEVCGRVRAEERLFLKNQNEKRRGFCDEWQVPNTRECVTKTFAFSFHISIILKKIVN